MSDCHPTVDGVDVEHRRVDTGDDVELHVAVAGPEDGEPVVLLHGFPDFWYGWRHQIPALVDGGYRVWAPDQRGYNHSDAPAAVAAYDIDTLTEDALSVLDEAGDGEIHLVAHDWGATVGWWAATEYPERIDRFVPMNVPHPTVIRRTIKRDPRQLARSLYALFYQLPTVPELLFEARNYRMGTEILRGSARQDAFDESDLEECRRAWSRSGAVTGMLNWYRAFLRHYPGDPPDPHVAPPTALFWGAEDPALRETMARPSVDLCEDGRLVTFSGVAHWPHREATDIVNELLVDFLSGEALR